MNTISNASLKAKASDGQAVEPGICPHIEAVIKAMALLLFLLPICFSHVAAETTGATGPATRADLITAEILVLDQARSTLLARGATPSDSWDLRYLDERIRQLCGELFRSSPGSVAGLPCPAPDALIPDASVVTAPASPAAGPEAELMESLGRFDELLAQEQERIHSRRKQGQRGGGAGAGGNWSQGADGKAGSGGGQEGGSSSSASNPSGEAGQEGPEADQGEPGATGVGGEGRQVAGSPGQQQGSMGAGGGQGKGAQGEETGRPPIYEDDDIVARQLREAAEKETDPELKEKLWEEYRRYKEAQSKK